MTELSLTGFVQLNLAADRFEASHARRASLLATVARTDELLERPAAEVLRALPGIIGTEMACYGWRWNGFYLLGADGNLHLGPAHGPPVCTPLESHGGPLSSGMCFDALHFDQTLAAYDVKQWPGYVSCDAASGLGTVSGIVTPLRDRDGRARMVWDLDAEQVIHPIDVRFAEVFFSTLAVRLALDAGVRAELG